MSVRPPNGWDAARNNALIEELRITFAAFPQTGGVTPEARFNAYAEQLSVAANAAEIRLAFSKARMRATRWAPTAGEVRECLMELRTRASHAPGRIADLPPTPPLDAALAWAAESAWNTQLVERELEELTRDWGREMLAERERIRSWAAVRVYRRLHAGERSA